MKAAAFLLILMAGVALADTLPDPTRPPQHLLAPTLGGESEGTESVPRLQTVLLHGDRKPRAIINGRLVGLGGAVGEGRLRRLTETEAVIVGPQGVQHLQLTPDVEIVPVQNTNIARKSSGKTKDKP